MTTIDYRGGRRGLGQDDGSHLDLSTAYPISQFPGGGTGVPAETDISINWNSLLSQLVGAGTTIGKQFASYSNPIYNLAPETYYQQTPWGTVVSTAGTPGTNPLATVSSSSLMPLLLLGGGVLLAVMVARK
jgi:hypothetical protein